jgi:hypothetical protein
MYKLFPLLVLAILALALRPTAALAGPLFGAKTDYATGGHPISVAIGDLNGDGRLDLVTANDDPADDVSVLLGNGDGTFGAKTDYGTGVGPYSVVIRDLNGDGKPDLVVTNVNSNTVCSAMATAPSARRRSSLLGTSPALWRSRT